MVGAVKRNENKKLSESSIRQWGQREKAIAKWTRGLVEVDELGVGTDVQGVRTSFLVLQVRQLWWG